MVFEKFVCSGARALSLCITLLPANGALADPLDSYVLEVLKHTPSVKVLVFDDVKEGCWRDPSTTKTVIEEKLLKSGIPVKDDGPVYVFSRRLD